MRNKATAHIGWLLLATLVALPEPAWSGDGDHENGRQWRWTLERAESSQEASATYVSSIDGEIGLSEIRFQSPAGNVGVLSSELTTDFGLNSVIFRDETSGWSAELTLDLGATAPSIAEVDFAQTFGSLSANNTDVAVTFETPDGIRHELTAPLSEQREALLEVIESYPTQGASPDSLLDGLDFFEQVLLERVPEAAPFRELMEYVERATASSGEEASVRYNSDDWTESKTEVRGD